MRPFVSGRLCLTALAGLLTCAAAWTVAAGEEAMRLEPVPPQGIWREVVTDAYTARIYGCGQIEVLVDGKKAFSGAFIERWKSYQDQGFVRYPRAAIRLSSDNLSAEAVFSYFWNGGQVEERLTFTSHSIAVDCRYRPERDRGIGTFTYFIACPLDGGPGPDLVGGIYRYDKQDAVDELGKWQEFKPRLSSISLRGDDRIQLDFLAEGTAWLFLWKDQNNGFIGLGDNGVHWDKASRKAGEVFRLGLLVWFSNRDGTNFSEATLRIEIPAGNRDRNS